MNMKGLEWLAGNLLKHDQIASISIVGDTFLHLERKEHEPVLSLVMSVQRVTANLIEDAMGKNPTCVFACNIPKNGLWEQGALAIALQHGLGWGGVGDLMSVLNDEDVGLSEPRKYQFGSRFLRQHGRIGHTERISDSVVQITTRGGAVYRVAMLYEYEMTADAVRTHFDRYQPFDIILRTNPNGGPTAEAREAATQMGLHIFKYTELSNHIRER